MSLAVSTAPSLVQVTVVAGEPDEVQFRVKGDLVSEVISSEMMDAGAVR